MIAFNVRAAFAMVLAKGEEKEELQDDAAHHRALVERARSGAAAIRGMTDG